MDDERRIEMEYNLPVISNDNYCNPVGYTDDNEHTNPDPFVLRWCGKYYCYSTDEYGINISDSENLIQWVYHGYAIREENYRNYWAPAVFYHNGVFYMYYSNTQVGYEEDDCCVETLKLAVSSTPYGPFIYKKTFLNKFSIDAHPIKYEGEMYLFYSTNDWESMDDKKVGTTILVDKLIDMETLEENPSVTILPSIEEEIFERNRFGDGRDWYTIEGACYLENGDMGYLLYSANAYINTDYFIGYAKAKKKKNFLNMKWKKYPNQYTYAPLAKKNSRVEGTGHNTVVKAPNLVDDWIIYHGRDADKELIQNKEQRVMRIDPIYINGERLITNAPSNQIQEAPFQPYLYKKELCLNDIKLFTKENEYYLMELSIIPKAAHWGARYSILVNYCDEANFIEILFQSGCKQIQVIVHSDNIVHELMTWKLPKDYNQFAIHTIQVRKAFYRYQVTIDEGLPSTFIYHMQDGKIGVKPYFTEVEVRGLTITRHISLWNKELVDLNKLFKVKENIYINDEGVQTDCNCTYHLKRVENSASKYVEEITFQPKKNAFVMFYLEYQNGTSKKILELEENIEIYSIRITKIEQNIWILANGEVCKPEIDFKEVIGAKICMKGVAITNYKMTSLVQKSEIESKIV